MPEGKVIHYRIQISAKNRIRENLYKLREAGSFDPKLLQKAE